MQTALNGKADNSNVPRTVWTGDVALNENMSLNQETYFGGAFITGTILVMTLYCTGNDAWDWNCVTVPIRQYVGYQSYAEFSIPSDRGAPERGRFVIEWASSPGPKITVAQAAQISSSGGTNWSNASGRFHLIQVTRIDPA